MEIIKNPNSSPTVRMFFSSHSTAPVFTSSMIPSPHPNPLGEFLLLRTLRILVFEEILHIGLLAREHFYASPVVVLLKSALSIIFVGFHTHILPFPLVIDPIPAIRVLPLLIRIVSLSVNRSQVFFFRCSLRIATRRCNVIFFFYFGQCLPSFVI